MKKLSIVAGAVAAVLFVGSAFAAGEGDLAPEKQAPFTGVLQRASVQADLVAAQKSGQLLRAGEAIDGSYGVAALPTDRARNDVRAEAVAAAHAPHQNLDRKSFVNSVVPAAYTHGSLATARQASVGNGVSVK